MLAAEDRSGRGHLGLDEGVADPGAHGGAAVLGDDLRDRAGGDQVVDDRRAGVAGEFAGGDQRGERAGRDGLAALVDDEAAVGVAVEGQPDVRADLADRACRSTQVGRVDRVGLVVGEGAVELEVQRDDRRAAGRPKTAGTV